MSSPREYSRGYSARPPPRDTRASSIMASQDSGSDPSPSDPASRLLHSLRTMTLQRVGEAPPTQPPIHSDPLTMPSERLPIEESRPDISRPTAPYEYRTSRSPRTDEELNMTSDAHDTLPSMGQASMNASNTESGRMIARSASALPRRPYWSANGVARTRLREFGSQRPDPSPENVYTPRPSPTTDSTALIIRPRPLETRHPRGVDGNARGPDVDDMGWREFFHSMSYTSNYTWSQFDRNFDRDERVPNETTIVEYAQEVFGTSLTTWTDTSRTGVDGGGEADSRGYFPDNAVQEARRTPHYLVHGARPELHQESQDGQFDQPDDLPDLVHGHVPSTPLPPPLIRRKESISTITIKKDAETDTDAARQLEQLEGNECPICREEYQEPVSTACGHIFCKECVWTWMHTHDKCPTCMRTHSAYRLVRIETDDEESTDTEVEKNERNVGEQA